MIDIGKIIKRAWLILWNYKVLWIFGLLLAMTAGGGGSSNGSSYQFGSRDVENNYNSNNYDVPQGLQVTRDWAEQNVVPLFLHPERYVSTLIWIGVGILLFLILVAVILTITRYVSETAVIRMVDEYEQSGTKLKFKQGWKLGWTRRAFRMWLIDLVISLPVILFVLVLLGLGVLMYYSIKSGSSGLAVGGLITAIGLFFLFLFSFILWMVFLNFLRQFFIRLAALEDTGVRESFRNGWLMFKHNWKSAALMWLVMLGIGFGFGIAGFFVFFLVIPLMVVMILPAAVVAAIPGLIAFGITSLFAGAPLTWIIAAIVAAPFFMAIVFLPLAFIDGLYKVFASSIWTLTYREMKALEHNLPVEIPAPVI